jgi:hypothetical protein
MYLRAVRVALLLGTLALGGQRVLHLPVCERERDGGERGKVRLHQAARPLFRSEDSARVLHLLQLVHQARELRRRGRVELLVACLGAWRGMRVRGRRVG